jgi:hypothetical protein
MNDINKLSKPKYETFEAVYTSGLIIDDSLLTALCLIFDKIHILHNLEFAIEFAKNYTLQSVSPKLAERANNIELTPVDQEASSNPNPLSILNPEQQYTARCYLARIFDFGLRYYELFKEGVINCTMYKDNKPIEIEMVKEGKPGELNTYQITLLTPRVSLGGFEQLNQMIKIGKVPILGSPHLQPQNAKTQFERFTPSQLASKLALRSLNLVLPETKPARDETILEARARLRDYLPPFWSSMLHLTSFHKSLLDQNLSSPDIERECDIIIDTDVRPKLIDLNQKIIKERKNWFSKIVTPVAAGVKMLAAKPLLTTTNLYTIALALGVNIAVDRISESLKPSASTQQSGLTLLIELDKYLRNRRSV